MRGDCALAGELVVSRLDVGGVTGRPREELELFDSPSPSSNDEPRPVADIGLKGGGWIF